MKRLIIIFLCLVVFTGCYRELKHVVERDVMVFDGETFQEEFIHLLSQYQVVVVGEYHGVLEHNQLLVDLILELNHKSNFDQLLLEIPHSLGWIIEDYINGIIDHLPPFFEGLGMINLTHIRDYNLNLVERDRIHVHAIDINHNIHFLRASLDFLLTFDFFDGSTIEDLLKFVDYHREEILQDESLFILSVEDILEELKEDQEKYLSSWGERWYYRIIDIFHYEIVSYHARKHLIENDVQKRTEIREDLMKEITDRYLKDRSNRTLINVGANHAQKIHVRGTENEWLAEYLVKRGPYSKDNTYVFVVIPGRGLLEWGRIGDYRDIDLTRNSRKFELFQFIHTIAGEKPSFLHLDDPIFESKEIYLNFHFEEIKTLPQKIFDGIYILPEISPSR